MSLRQRQRHTQVTATRTTSEASETPTVPCSGESWETAQKASSSDPDNSRGPSAPPHTNRKRIRLNRVLGRIVPIILLVYIAYAYDLVVIRYAYRHLYIRHKRIVLPILWLLPTHVLFLWSLRVYLKVFFAHDHSTHNRKNNRSVLEWLSIRLGATFPDPYKAQLQEQNAIREVLSTLLRDADYPQIHVALGEPDGQPVRCWRDNCGGRIKPFRTRHCGDCGTCRVGFDHHCAWFDNDVTASATLRPFLGFLVSIPPLYVLGLGPLFPSAVSTLRRINRFASNDPSLRTVWWSRWYSWVGGPAFRWMVGFSLGASRWARATTHRLPHESPRAPLLLALGAVFVFVATALATSSFTHLRHGELTVDVERSKSFIKLQHKLHRLQDDPHGRNRAKIAAIRAKMDSLAPTQHFRVASRDSVSGETKQNVVALSFHNGLLSHGSPRINLQRFLGIPPTSQPIRPAWSISDQALREALEKAALLPHDQ